MANINKDEDCANEDHKFEGNDELMSYQWPSYSIHTNVESYFLEGFSFGLNDDQEKYNNSKIVPLSNLSNISETDDKNDVEDTRIVEDLASHFLTDKVFDSRTELFDYCQVIARSLNTVIVTHKSKKDTNKRRGRLMFACERFGFYRCIHKSDDSEIPKKKNKFRDTSTKKCGCPFMLKGVPLGGERWKLEVVCGLHNHIIAKTLIGHSCVARLKEEERKIVRDLSLCGVKPKQILATIKNRDSSNLSKMKTVYNVKSKLRLKKLEGRSLAQQLLKMLDEKHYVHFCLRVSNTDELVDIFWAHPDSMLLARCFPSVVLVDCTYKTNRYNLPLLQIVGCTSTSKTFCIALALIHHERQENYEWTYTRLRELFDPNALPTVFVSDRDQASMNAIEKVFPDANLLLCCFHIAMNVSGKCKPLCEKKKNSRHLCEDGPK